MKIWLGVLLAVAIDSHHLWPDEFMDHPTIQETMLTANVEREKRSIKPLTLDPSLCRQAQRHANWMGREGKFEHSKGAAGEIIAMGTYYPKDAIDAWINSTGHRRILFSGSKCGFGFKNQNGTRYWVGIIR